MLCSGASPTFACSPAGTAPFITLTLTLSPCDLTPTPTLTRYAPFRWVEYTFSASVTILILTP